MKWFRKSKQHRQQDRLLAYLKEIDDELIERRQVVIKYLDPIFKDPVVNERVEQSITKVRSEILVVIRLIEKTIKEDGQ